MSLRDYSEFGKLIDKITGAIINGSISHAYIFEADSCIDKMQLAKDFFKAVLCLDDRGYGCEECVNCRKIEHNNYEDLYVVTADDLSVKDADISDLQEKLKNKPLGDAKRNLAIISNADSMTVRAQNRLLKTLEEPQQGTIIVLLSENTQNLLPTITSRCVIYRFNGFFNNRNIDLTFPENVMEMVARGAYFFELKKILDKNIKSRGDANTFLDGLERVMRNYLVKDGNGLFSKEKIIKNVNYVEEARKELSFNLNYKYVIRNLILKIGG